MTEEKSKGQCPKGCGKILETKQEWIDHFKKEHPEVETLRWGTKEKIDLRKKT